jgi:hypothetical protein
MTATSLQCELRYRKEATKRVNGRGEPEAWVIDEERKAKLAAIPSMFEETKGSYSDVSRVAVRLNEAQIRSGFIDYLFFPEPVSASATSGR